MEYFVEEYFDQNPISQVTRFSDSVFNKRYIVKYAVWLTVLSSQIGIITTKNKRAEKLTDLAGWCFSVMF